MMPFHLPFYPPYFSGPSYRHTYTPNNISTRKPITVKDQEVKDTKTEDSTNSTNRHFDESSEYFFEIFGLKLYYDDILIICLLYFLYNEGIQDQELFLCLILLLIS